MISLNLVPLMGNKMIFGPYIWIPSCVVLAVPPAHHSQTFRFMDGDGVSADSLNPYLQD